MLKLILVFIVIGLLLHHFDINVYEVVHSEPVQSFWNSVSRNMEMATSTSMSVEAATSSSATSSEIEA